MLHGNNSHQSRQPQCDSRAPSSPFTRSCVHLVNFPGHVVCAERWARLGGHSGELAGASSALKELSLQSGETTSENIS